MLYYTKLYYIILCYIFVSALNYMILGSKNFTAVFYYEGIMEYCTRMSLGHCILQRVLLGGSGELSNNGKKMETTIGFIGFRRRRT